MSKSHWTSALDWFKLTVFCITAITTVKIAWAGFACLESPCMHGICIDYLDVNSSSMCYCVNGYTGFHCEINWDECFHLSPCLNGGSCSDGIASFNCSCPENFAGALCEHDLSSCDCQNNGSCNIDLSYGNETISCICEPGFVGAQCEVDISICNTTDNACLNGGVCNDGLGDKFQCQCPPGWDGEICQNQIDNCESSPCHNGAICVNKLNDFACACPFGYAGKGCEKKLKICEVNPCKNGAFCLHEDENVSKKTCYCVPDFGGDFCEFKYDDCSPAPRCHNGGTCIDGVGAFSCSCPPNFFGPACQCTAENMTEPACQNNETITRPSEIWPYPATTFSFNNESTKFQAQSELASGIQASTLLLTPFSSVTVEEVETPTIIISGIGTILLSRASEPAFSSESKFTIDSAKPFPMSSTAISPMESFTIISGIEPSISLEGSEVSVPISPSSFMSLFPTPVSTWPPTSEGTESLLISEGVLTPPAFGSITPGDLHSAWLTSSISLKLPDVDPDSSITTSKLQGENGESLITNIFSTASGSLQSILQPAQTVPSNNNMTEIVLFTQTMPTIITDLISTDVATEPTISYEFSTVELESGYQYSTFLISTQLPATNLSTALLPSTEQLSQFSDTLPGSLISPNFVTPTMSVNHTQPLVSLSDGVFSIPYSSMSLDFATKTTVSDVDAISLLLPSTDISIMAETISVEVSSHSYFPSLKPTGTLEPTPSSNYLTTPEPSLIYSSPSPPPSHTANSSQAEDPCHNFCSNDGKCISDSIQPICICSFKFSGERCETPRKRFKTVSFTGNSFLEYKVPNDSMSRINVKTRLATNAPDAILLFYTVNSKSRLYALIFTQGGHVAIHFSCGEQSMHFVETRQRVDNGKNFTLEFSMEMVVHPIRNETQVHCIGQVKVNHSFIMRGEQIVGRNEPYENSAIYLGGADANNEHAKKSDDLISIMPGLRGCSYSLEINEESKDLFLDAVNGQQISECSAFGCVTNPCQNSKCIPSNQYPFWECICNPGYQGSRCQVRVCDTNPCQNGANCIIEETNEIKISNSTEITTSPQPRCLCSLGYTGKQCQASLNLTKPSFNPIGFDYSAYITYEQIPRFADWVQLKLHFVIRNYSQIALLLYSGYSHVGLTSSTLSNRDDLDALAELLKEGGSLQDEDLLETGNSNDNNEIGPGNQKVSDFFAITYIQGYVGLTWNLGSGTQRIISPGRIDKRIQVHTLFAGRSGRKAWIKVDGMRNTSGKSPGPFHRLNVNEIYLGGHEAFRFEGLPHDLPMHKGFNGCIFDFGFRVKQRLYLPRSLRGRNVKNCYEEDC